MPAKVLTENDGKKHFDLAAPYIYIYMVTESSRILHKREFSRQITDFSTKVHALHFIVQYHRQYFSCITLQTNF